MNFDILLKSIPEEAFNTFLEKKTRFDNRKFTDIREFTYIKNALNFYENNLIGSIGLNKVILVLKQKPINLEINQQNFPIINIILDNFNSLKSKNLNKIKDFVNKLIQNNFVCENQENNKKIFELYITIENIDGNIYDTISLSIQKFFEENILGLKIKNNFTSKTLSVINNIILYDPSEIETKLSDFTFNIIKFNNDKYYINKIRGQFINWNLIKEVINNI
jgi:exosome complex RNA-binding protein Rrp42 (RNase PH superfamily)